ncbi:nodulation protein NfeD [candidate division KSB1 bacterium]|nr:MAG: nodulation protein NfeD [candidate division KSB1 bacterium]
MAFSAGKQVMVINVNGPITPVKLKYISDNLLKAEKLFVECLIIELDTPGGLMQSTWDIDKKILASSVPVVVYITPSGGRAASAGVYITYAAHIAVMAPSTNIGSAHPVTMGKQDTSAVMLEKITNDAVAHIKGLADARGRNEEWAVQAVKKSVSITSKEALKIGVINFIAKNREELLNEIDGSEVKLPDGTKKLKTRDVEVIFNPMNWQYKILDRISDPNIAYLLLLAGMAGIFFELKSPGAIFPGALGGVALILAFFSMQVLPINAAGILLILLGVLFFILEIHITSFGLLTIGGVISMLLGSLMLFKSPEMSVSLDIVIPAVFGMALFIVVALGLAIKAQKKKVTTGLEGLIGESGTVARKRGDVYQINIHGEIWKSSCNSPLKSGDKVVVTGVSNMMLIVEKKSK